MACRHRRRPQVAWELRPDTVTPGMSGIRDSERQAGQRDSRTGKRTGGRGRIASLYSGHRPRKLILKILRQIIIKIGWL